MAAKKKAATTKKKEQPTKQDLITAYMEHVLEHEHTPRSVYKFAKDNDMTEAEFYELFGSFDGLRREIWNQFFTLSHDAIKNSDEYEHYSNREKMLSFFFTFFELLTLNRSYVLYALDGKQDMLYKLDQLRGLRKHMKHFATHLIQERNDTKTNILMERSERVYSEGAWVQMLFLIKFWIDDDSAGFEKTDMAIEKSVNTIFDVFDNTPLDAVIDFGKFLWKERMS